MNQQLFDIALSYDESLTPIEKVALFKKFGSSKSILELNKGTLKNILGRRWTGNRFVPEKFIEKAESNLSYLNKSNIKVLRFDDENYPYGLKMIPDCPFLIFVRGQLNYEFEKSISIVGTRKPDNRGFKNADDFSEFLTKKDYAVISGLAHGIDAAAHYSCLKNNGKTIAVLGCGIDRIYPFANKELAKQILLNNGGIISEYPPGVKPNKWNFPRRNRIIVGLTKGVVIIQSPGRSGSLITATLAADYNRDLYVVKPNSKNNIKEEGNFELILNGAAGIDSPLDIISDLEYLTK